MRVLHVAADLDASFGGSTSAAFHTCGYLRAAGVDAELAGTLDGGSTAHITDDWPDLPVHAFPAAPPRHYCHSPKLRRWLHANAARFDLVVVHGVFKIPFVDGAIAARRRRRPYLVHPHGSLDPYDLQKHRAFKAVYGPAVVRPMLSGCAAVVVTAAREGASLRTWGATPTVDVVSLPVPEPPIVGDGAAFRARFGIDDDAPLVVFLSRLDPKKGIERLLDAVAAVRRRRPRLRLAMVGGGLVPAYDAEVRRRATALGLDDAVVWTGALTGDDKWHAFAAADVFALPSDNENFGIVAVEAALAGAPLLLSTEVYIAHELVDVGDGIVCRPEPASVESCLDVLLDRPDGRALAMARRDAVRDRFSPAASTAATIAVYERVLAAGSGASGA